MRTYVVVDFEHIITADTDGGRASQIFQEYDDFDDTDSDWVSMHVYENGTFVETFTRYRDDNAEGE